MQVNTRSIYKRLWQGAVWEQGRACYTRSRFSGRVSPALLGVGAGWAASLQCWPGCCCSAHTFVSKSDGSPEMWQWNWSWGWVNPQIFWFYHLAGFLMVVVAGGGVGCHLPVTRSNVIWREPAQLQSKYGEMEPGDVSHVRWWWSTSLHPRNVSTFINLTGIILLGWGRQLKTDIACYVVLLLLERCYASPYWKIQSKLT